MTRSLTSKRSPSVPKVFISYTHESTIHRQWVAKLAADLRNNGVNAVLDQWECGPGDDLTLFMEHGIRSAHRVLLICTPRYAKKVNDARGGVGYERLVVTSELAAKIDTNKFVCVLRSGAPNTSIPVFAKSRVFLDLRDDAEYKEALDQTLRSILQVPADRRPPLGESPFAKRRPPRIAAAIPSSSPPPIGPSPYSSNVIERIVERIVARPLRRHLPETRNGITHKFKVGEAEGYITAGLYDDGSPGEVFITTSTGGSAIGGLMDTVGSLISISLQYGVPIESLVRKFEDARFEPNGATSNPDIPNAKSLTDYVFRWLGMEFVPGYRAANSPRRSQGKHPDVSKDVIADAARMADNTGAMAKKTEEQASNRRQKKRSRR